MSWYTLPKGKQLDEITSSLKGSFSWERPQSSHQEIYDTFIGSLAAQDLQLALVDKTAVLYRTDTGEELMSGSLRLPPDPSVLPPARLPGEIQGRIPPEIGDRVLLHIGSISYTVRSGTYSNRDGKIVCRLALCEAEGSTAISIEPLRGYRKSEGKIVEAGSLIETVSEAAWRMAAMEQLISCQAVPAFTVHAEVSINDAFTHICTTLIRFIRGNEFGVIGEFDTEFLHDYRVSIRKTRVAFDQFRPIIKRGKFKRFSRFFKLLGTETTPVRDLDVFLGNLGTHELFSGFEETELKPFITYLKRARRSDQKHLVSRLESIDYQAECDAWEQLLTEETKNLCRAKGDKPFLPFARKRLKALYEQILEDGNAITHATREERIHTLRKDCKKLRYMLMFTSSLFDPEPMEKLLITMKSLQDLLGNFNDLCVHIAYMEQFSQYLASHGAQQEQVGHAVRVIDSLQTEKTRFFPEFEQTFGRFSSKKQQKNFYRMIHITP